MTPAEQQSSTTDVLLQQILEQLREKESSDLQAVLRDLAVGLSAIGTELKGFRERCELQDERLGRVEAVLTDIEPKTFDRRLTTVENATQRQGLLAALFGAIGAALVMTGQAMLARGGGQ